MLGRPEERWSWVVGSVSWWRQISSQNLTGLESRRSRSISAPVPRIGDGVIRGEFIAVDKGSAIKRVIIGFGAGAAELQTLVETYQVTASGLRPLGSAQIDAAGSKMPGMLVPVGVGAAVGGAATSAALSGAANLAGEAGPETIEAAAQRTAKEIAKGIVASYKKRGWL